MHMVMQVLLLRRREKKMVYFISLPNYAASSDLEFMKIIHLKLKEYGRDNGDEDDNKLSSIINMYQK